MKLSHLVLQKCKKCHLAGQAHHIQSVASTTTIWAFNMFGPGNFACREGDFEIQNVS